MNVTLFRISANKISVFSIKTRVFENEDISDNIGDFVSLISGKVWFYKVLKKQNTWCLLHGWKLEI